jgi:hypothetical protein
MVGILMAADPSQQKYEQRIILLYFAAKTLQHQHPLSFSHVPLGDIAKNSQISQRNYTQW